MKNVVASALLAAAAVGATALPAAAQTINADECVNATVISGMGPFSFDTRFASQSQSPGFFFGSFNMNYDVWARWTAPQSGWLLLDTCLGANPYATVSIYQGGDCASLVPLAVGFSGPCYSDQALFWVHQGQAYTFRLDTPQRIGQFTLSYSTPFPGDDCNNAIDISGVGMFNFDNTQATSAYLASDPYQYVSNDVWYRWTAPESAQTYIHSCDMLGPRVFQIFTDQGCPVTQDSVAFNAGAPGCGLYGARVDFTTVAGQTYLIRTGFPNNPWARLGDGLFEIVQIDEGPPTGGETIVVTMTGDFVDFIGAQRVADLPGYDGQVSFREAIIAANNTPGRQRIEFNIPEWIWSYPLFGYAAILNTQGPFIITDEVEIDGWTQTANVGDSNPNGPDVGFFNPGGTFGSSPCIIVRADNVVIRGIFRAYLMGHAVWVEDSANTVIEECVWSTSLQGGVTIRNSTSTILRDNVLGGGTQGFGLRIEQGSTGTIVQGNTIRGRLDGMIVSSSSSTTIGGPDPAHRNVFTTTGTYITEGFPTGTYLHVSGSTDTVIENNFIGLSADGATGVNTHGTEGLVLSGNTNTVVRNNVISDMDVFGANHYAGQRFGAGLIIGANTNTRIIGNRIGADAAGQTAIPNLEGVRISGSNTGLVFGGPNPGDGNLVAHSIATGIRVTASSADIWGNSIHGNGLLGIDLGPAGVTPNDPGDFDSGPNGLQNFPDLTSATGSGGGTQIQGFLDSLPGATFRLDFFASAQCDPTGFGEGERFLGSAAVTTGPDGTVSFAATVPGGASAGDLITSTATNIATGQTSEFSACIPADGGNCPADWNGDNTINSADISAYITSWLASVQNGTLEGDFNDDDEVNSTDISAFITAWLAAVAGGC